ncbi:O-antigen polymerase [Bacillus marasmi]|uniref:O-antigen polymerase n=1 Tax=Bacillus marasmi TaxID=1926279 RepID=UPI0011CBB2D4|nr:O-antigen polymerase [Bacillus marasmi]
MKILHEKWGFFLTLLVFSYMFIGGYIISVILIKEYPRYYQFSLNENILLFTFIGLSIVFGYYFSNLSANMIPTKKYTINFFKFNAIDASLISLFIAVVFIFERLLKLGFMPFWIYDPFYIASLGESGYPGIGFTILSISAGLDFLIYYKNNHQAIKNKKLLLIFLVKVLLLFLYSRSRGLLVWLVIIIIFYFISRKNVKFKNVLTLSLISVFTLLLYRIVSELSVSSDFEYIKFKLLFDIAPEFKDLSTFLIVYVPNWFPNIKYELIQSYMLSILPEGIWSIVGLSKLTSSVNNIGAFGHELLFGNQDRGVRLTPYAEFFMFGGKVGMVIGGFLIGYLQGYFDRRKSVSLFAFLMIINIAYSQLFNIKAMVFRFLPIVIIVIIYGYQWIVLNRNAIQEDKSK